MLTVLTSCRLRWEPKSTDTVQVLVDAQRRYESRKILQEHPLQSSFVFRNSLSLGFPEKHGGERPEDHVQASIGGTGCIAPAFGCWAFSVAGVSRKRLHSIPCILFRVRRKQAFSTEKHIQCCAKIPQRLTLRLAVVSRATSTEGLQQKTEP